MDRPGWWADAGSISSILERTVRPAESLDRLSFLSICREYSRNDCDISKISNSAETNTTVRTAASQTFVPKLRFGDGKNPYGAHQVYIDGTQDGSAANNNEDPKIWNLHAGLKKPRITFNDKPSHRSGPTRAGGSASKEETVGTDPSPGQTTPVSPQFSAAKGTLNMADFYSMYTRQPHVCVITSSKQGASETSQINGDSLPTYNQCMETGNKLTERTTPNSGSNTACQRQLDRVAPAAGRPVTLPVTTAVHSDSDAATVELHLTPWSEEETSFWEENRLDAEAVSIDDYDLEEDDIMENPDYWLTDSSMDMDELIYLTSLEDPAAAADMSRERAESQRSGKLSNKRKPLNQLPSDREFQQGVVFSCRYIGSMSLSKPKGKEEVLSAMRRVRTEYKSRNAKKKKVVLTISTENVTVHLDRKNNIGRLSEDNLLMTDPIYHVFYVSHDSQDSQVFSYISRRNAALKAVSPRANSRVQAMEFHCHVFKTAKKASMIVQCLGRVFDVYYELVNRPRKPSLGQALERFRSSDSEPQYSTVRLASEKRTPESLNDSVFVREETNTTRQSQRAPRSNGSVPTEGEGVQMHQEEEEKVESQRLKSQESEHQLSQQQEIDLLWLQLEHQEHQIAAAVSQTELLRQQVAIETQSRNDAELRCHQLLLHNKDLLEHINRLSVENKELKERLSMAASGNPEYRISEPILSSSHMSPSPRANGETTTREPYNKMSPDSGHREMSSKTSTSDLYEEWEKKHAAEFHTKNTSYQLSARCEQEEMIRQLSTRDIAQLVADYSKEHSDADDELNDSAVHEDGSSGQGDRELPGGGGDIDDAEARAAAADAVNHDELEEEYSLANKSFGYKPQSPVLPTKPADAASLLRTLMLSGSDKKLLHLSKYGSDSGSRQLSSSVNDIYTKMSRIRRSLENMETVVGRRLAAPALSHEGADSQQELVRRRSGVPPPSKRHVYTEITELREQLNRRAGATNSAVAPRAPDECDTVPSKLERSGLSAAVSAASANPANPSQKPTGSKRRPAYRYENVALSDDEPLDAWRSRSRRSLSADVDGERSRRSGSSEPRANHSSSVLSLQSRYSPQKETTLSRKIETRQSSQTSLHNAGLPASSHQSNTCSKERSQSSSGHQGDLTPEKPVKLDNKGGKSLKGKKLNRNYSSSTYRVKYGRRARQSPAAENPSEAECQRKAVPTQRSYFLPIQNGSRSISVDSLNSPTFDNPDVELYYPSHGK